MCLCEAPDWSLLCPCPPTPPAARERERGARAARALRTMAGLRLRRPGTVVSGLRRAETGLAVPPAHQELAPLPHV